VSLIVDDQEFWGGPREPSALSDRDDVLSAGRTVSSGESRSVSYR
jgi:hypothetical protein